MAFALTGGEAHEGRCGEGRAVVWREKALEGGKPMRATRSLQV